MYWIQIHKLIFNGFEFNTELLHEILYFMFIIIILTFFHSLKRTPNTWMYTCICSQRLELGPSDTQVWNSFKHSTANWWSIIVISSNGIPQDCGWEQKWIRENFVWLTKMQACRIGRITKVGWRETTCMVNYE